MPTSLPLLRRLQESRARKSHRKQLTVRQVSRTQASFPSLRIQNAMKIFSPIGSWTSSESRKAQPWQTLAQARDGSRFGRHGEWETAALFTRWTSIEIILTTLRTGLNERAWETFA